MNPTTTQQLLHLKIISPKEVIFEGDVSSISSTNSMGKFDILPEHANFITFIQNQPIRIIDKSGKAIDFKYALAIIYTFGNQVRVYTEIQLAQKASLIKS